MFSESFNVVDFVRWDKKCLGDLAVDNLLYYNKFRVTRATSPQNATGAEEPKTSIPTLEGFLPRYILATGIAEHDTVQPQVNT